MMTTGALRLQRWQCRVQDPTPAVPEDPGMPKERVIVPFIVVEHQNKQEKRIGILVLDPAAA